MAIEFKDGKYVDPQTGRVTLDPTVYKDWQIAEEAEKNLPSVDYFREKLGLLPEEIIPYGKAPKIANDILSTRGYQNLIRGALTDIPCLYAYIFTDWRMWVYLFDLVEAAGFGVKSEIVWDKGTPGMGVGWRSQHELILFGAKAATHFDGHKGYGNVLSISRSGNELHPTQKPVELLEKLVDNTDFATGVYDPFGGSGTTLAACEAYGQPSYIMELTPAFTDVIVKRYIRITGKTTVRCVRQGRELPREEIAAIFEPDEEGGEQE